MHTFEQARMARAAGFTRLWISDHFHLWNSEQGQSPVGVDEIHVQQIGPDMQGFFDAYRDHVHSALS